MKRKAGKDHLDRETIAEILFRGRSGPMECNIFREYALQQCLLEETRLYPEPMIVPSIPIPTCRREWGDKQIYKGFCRSWRLDLGVVHMRLQQRGTGITGSSGCVLCAIKRGDHSFLSRVFVAISSVVGEGGVYINRGY